MAQNRRQSRASLRKTSSQRNIARRRRPRRFTSLIGEWLEPRNLLVGTASIAGLIWNDVDGDGSRGANEPVQSGVTVYLDLNDNKTLDVAEPTRVTAGDGSYSFTNLDAGNYVVREQTPTNFQITSPRASGQRMFTIQRTSPPKIVEIDVATGGQRNIFSAPAGTTYVGAGLAFDGQNVWFMADSNDTLYRLNSSTGAILSSTTLPGGGYGSLAAMGGKIYVLNSSSRQAIFVFDPSTSTITGALTLQAGVGVGSGMQNSLGESPATNELVFASYHRVNFLDATTGIQTHSFELGYGFDVNGVHAFGDEILVTHGNSNNIEVYDRAGTFLRTIFLSLSPDETAGYADLSGCNRLTLIAGQAATNVNFGNQSVLGSIRGTRFQDVNLNGMRDAGELPLSGKTMYLDSNNNGSREAGEPTAVTAADGSYVFSNLAAGDYSVRADLTAGHSQTYPVITNDRLFVFDYVPTKIYELNPATGAVINTFNAPNDGYLGLAFDGITLYAISETNGNLYKINPNTGAILASADLGSGSFQGLAYANGKLYSEPNNDGFSVIDPLTMKVTGMLVTNPDVDVLWNIGQMVSPNRLLGLNSFTQLIQFDPITGASSVGYTVAGTASVIAVAGSGSKLFASDNNNHVNVYSPSGVLMQTLNVAPDIHSMTFYPQSSGEQRIALKPGGNTAGVDFGMAEPTAINQPPTLAAIAEPLAVAKDGSATVNLSGIFAGPFETQSLTISATSSNPGLIPNPAVTYTSPQSTASLLLTPSAGQIGTAVITVRVKDDAGTANGGNDTFVRTFNVIINSVPVLDATKTPTLPTLAEDPGAPSGAVGSLVTNLVDFTTPSGELDNVTDVDSGALLGIAVTGISSSFVCYYSLNGGTTWTNFSPVSTSNSRLIAADGDNRIYCQPNLNINGPIPSAMTFRAWDQTTGADGGTADTTVSGGGTAFSSATDGVSLTVTPVNDAPAATNLSSGETYTEDAARNLTNIVVSDVDSTTVTATLTLSNPSAGILSTSTSGAVTSTYSAATGVWTASGPITNVNTLLAAATFTPVANFNANFTIATRVSDDLNAAVSGSKAMTGSAINDVPNGTNLNVAESYTEDTPLNLTDIIVSDVDNLPLTVKLTLSNINAGSLSVATSGAVTSTYVAATGVWTASGAIADVNTLLAGVTFNPKLDFNGNFTIATNVSDGVAAAITGSKAMTGTAVNDAPTAANLNASETYTEDIARNLIDIVVADDSPVVTVTLTMSNPAAGSLSTGTSGVVTATYDTVTGIWTASGAIANINTLLAGIVFTPVPTASGNFTISVVMSDGITDASGSKSVTGIAVNDPPQGASATVTLLEDDFYTFTELDFGFSDPGDQPVNPGVPNPSFASVVIVAAPANGTLINGSQNLGAGSEVPNSAIRNLQLVFLPVLEGNGDNYGNFTFRVRDTGSNISPSVNLDPTVRTMTINITPVPDVPRGASKTATTNEDTAYTITAADLGFTDSNDLDVANGGASSLPPDVLLNVVIPSSPTNGTLFDSTGQILTFPHTIIAADFAVGSVRYVPSANLNSTGTSPFRVTFQVRDTGAVNNLDPIVRSITFNVRSVNDPPVGEDASLPISENQLPVSSSASGYLFAAADFLPSIPSPFDPNDNVAGGGPVNTLAGVHITSVPIGGSLFNGLTAITNTTTVVPVSVINAGQLKYVPNQYSNSSLTNAPAFGFTFKVQDNGGTVNSGQHEDVTNRTISFTVAAINTAPSGTDKTLTTKEDTSLTLQPSDFGFGDPNDDPANDIQAVRISSLPVVGSLTLAGNAISPGFFVTLEDLNSGSLIYTPPAHANGSPLVGASILFQVQDDGDIANGGLNLDPTPRQINFIVRSVNDAPHGSDKLFSLAEDASYNFTANDFGFSDLADASVGTSNSLAAVIITSTPLNGALLLNGTTVVTGGNVLTVGLIGQLAYKPDEDAHGLSYASFTFQVQDNGGVSYGGVDVDPTPNTFTFNVTPVNDPPSFLIGTNKSGTDESGPLSFVQWATALSAGPPNESAQELHFVIQSNSRPNLFAAGPTVDASGKLTFTPAPNVSGTAEITLQLNDDAGGNNASDFQTFQITITKPHRLFNSRDSGSRRGLDVTGSSTAAPDGFIVAADALAVVNYINAKGSGPVLESDTFGPPYCDVNGDNQVVAEDVIRIINYINAQAKEPEGESPASPAPQSNAPSTDLIALLAQDLTETALRRRRAL